MWWKDSIDRVLTLLGSDPVSGLRTNLLWKRETKEMSEGWMWETFQVKKAVESKAQSLAKHLHLLWADTVLSSANNQAQSNMTMHLPELTLVRDKFDPNTS